MIAKLLRKLVGLTAGNLLYALASVVPRDERLWLFSAWNGLRYLDNPKYIFEFVTQNYGDIDAIWICKDKALEHRLAAQGRKAVYAYSLRGIAYQLRAAVVVFTHAVSWDFVPQLIGHGVKRVQTWHGIPIKKIGYDDIRVRNARLRARVLTWLLWYENDRCDMVLAASETEAAKYLTAFNVSPSGIRITGYPRNDEIVRCAARREGRRLPVKAIYMPTYRGGVGSEFRLFAESGFDFAAADRLCGASGVELYIKLHPVQVFSAADRERIAASAHIKALANIDDIYERLGEFDILITDFSGIFFDFLVMGRPIIMAPIALEQYLSNDRELYYSYPELCPDEPCHSWPEVLARLGELARETFVPSPRYRALQARFHRYVDAASAQRAAVELRRLVGVLAEADAANRSVKAL